MLVVLKPIFVKIKYKYIFPYRTSNNKRETSKRRQEEI